MKSPIIDPAGTVIIGSMPHTYIHGGHGVHGQDLRRRLLLPEGTEENPAHFLALPIAKTEPAALELIENWVLGQNIISFSGVMTKAPDDVIAAHCLFGPKAEGNLKMALAMETFDENNVLVSSLIEKVKAQGIKIIETTKMEHDKKMAITQGLINLSLVMIGKNANVQNDLITQWQTPVGTVVDMIYENPFAKTIIKEFFELLLEHWNNVSQALAKLIKQKLTDQDIDDFWTPNSNRVIQSLSGPGSNIVIPKKEIITLRNSLDTKQGRIFLAQEIEEIRDRVKRVFTSQNG